VPADDADAEIIAILRKEQVRGGFHRVHAAPDSLIDVDDGRAIALVIVPPAHPHTARSAETTPAERIVADTLQRRGSGQRRYRNALVFVAADETGLGDCRQLARKYLAWKSIVEDKDLADALTRAQFDDASARMRQAA